jgi:hypothetical protein
MAGTSFSRAGAGPQQVADAANGHMDQTLANGWIGLDQAKALFASGGQDFGRLAAAAKTKGFRAGPARRPQGLRRLRRGGPQARLQERGRHPARHHARRRICALHRALGSSRALRQGADGDDICNGAIDNATGTAAWWRSPPPMPKRARRRAPRSTSPSPRRNLACSAALLRSQPDLPARADRRRRQYRRDAARPTRAQRGGGR